MSEKELEQPLSPEAPEYRDEEPKNVDYTEDKSIQTIHSAVMREQSEPKDGAEPLSLWLVGFCFLILFWGGLYLGQYSGGFSSTSFDERAGGTIAFGGAAIKASAATAVAAPKADDPIARGKRLFVANCASCHQATGLGQPGVYPSLHGSTIVNGGGGHLVRLVLHGAQGPWTAKSGQYNNAMTAWGPALTDKQIAQILTYIRQDFGNAASAIHPEQVAAIREAEKARRSPWTYDELMKAPDDDLPAAPAPDQPAVPVSAGS